ncbi:EF-hand domain-containing protein [Collimonas humicola]|uniref:EF-hand domain-containing protein n=1 Tax=Collimonas humicola TaxID=2825886 RepID=UPI001B8C27DB|nr:EF-hand domain-containing protein [Collimonas humicola]
MKSFLTLLAVSSLAIILPAAALAQSTVNATTTPARQGMAQLGDPYVPAHVKAAARIAARPAAAGASLQERALQKLQAKFSEADSSNSGSVTKAQAQQAGFGFVANNFEQIDVNHAGRVTFDNVKAYMRANGANF